MTVVGLDRTVLVRPDLEQGAGVVAAGDEPVVAAERLVAPGDIQGLVGTARLRWAAERLSVRRAGPRGPRTPRQCAMVTPRLPASVKSDSAMRPGSGL